MALGSISSTKEGGKIKVNWLPTFLWLRSSHLLLPFGYLSQPGPLPVTLLDLYCFIPILPWSLHLLTAGCSPVHFCHFTSALLKLGKPHAIHSLCSEKYSHPLNPQSQGWRDPGSVNHWATSVEPNSFMTPQCQPVSQLLPL